MKLSERDAIQLWLIRKRGVDIKVYTQIYEYDPEEVEDWMNILDEYFENEEEAQIAFRRLCRNKLYSI